MTCNARANLEAYWADHAFRESLRPAPAPEPMPVDQAVRDLMWEIIEYTHNWNADIDRTPLGAPVLLLTHVPTSTRFAAFLELTPIQRNHT